jgi:hypothetical protein
MKTIITFILLAFSVTLFAATSNTKNAFFQYYDYKHNVELEIAGTGYGHIRTDIPGDEGKEYACFGGIPIYDKKSRMLVGFANDCMTDIEDENGAISLKGFTFLDFFAPDGEVWTLMVTGGISVQPVTVKTDTAWGMDVTHITGSSVGRNNTNNTCVGGSGPFDGAECISRISGMVNMENMNPQDIDNSAIGFSCFFSIEDLMLQDWAIQQAAQSL